MPTPDTQALGDDVEGGTSVDGAAIDENRRVAHGSGQRAGPMGKVPVS
jgi:hypothetical protein